MNWQASFAAWTVIKWVPIVGLLHRVGYEYQTTAWGIRNDQKYALICTTPLFYVLDSTCFGSSLPSSRSFLDPSELHEIQTEWVTYHIMCGYVTCVPECRGSVRFWNSSYYYYRMWPCRASNVIFKRNQEPFMKGYKGRRRFTIPWCNEQHISSNWSQLR
jgi:hypothetical protein